MYCLTLVLRKWTCFYLIRIRKSEQNPDLVSLIKKQFLFGTECRTEIQFIVLFIAQIAQTFYHSNLWMQSPAAQRRLFWWDRTWPYRAKVWTFNIIKPVLCQGLIYQKSRLSTVHTLSYSTYYVGPEIVSHDSLLSLFVRLNGRVSHKCEPQFKKKKHNSFCALCKQTVWFGNFFSISGWN